jgi:NAD(P)-dependent dehydrogenase (short-subunit alcohol dehydrogenase family)
LFEFQGRVGVITGSAHGIGRGLARVFAQRGMHIVIADIDATAAETTAEEIRALGVHSIGLRTDVSDSASVEALAERAYAEFGTVHLLCNNAGVVVGKPITELSPQDWRWLYGVNVEGVVNGVRAFVPRMRQRATGEPAHIVNTSSIAGLAPLDSQNMGLYGATKAAILAYTEVLQRELAPENIGVSVLFPGRVPETNLSNSTLVRPEAFGGPSPAAPRGKMIPPSELPPGVTRWTMTPEEVAEKAVLGIQANRMYIVADPQRREAPETRFQRILADFDASMAEDMQDSAAS